MRPAVLVIGDDAAVRAAVGQFLHIGGFAPVTAVSSLDALRLLRAGLRVDAILLDVTTHVMDGCEFRRAQRSDPSIADIPVIVLTEAMPYPHEDVLSPAGVLRKPLAPESVLAAIRDVRRRRDAMPPSASLSARRAT